MFTSFLYELKRSGVPVSPTEWMTLMEALNKGLAYSSLSSFYYLARAVLVKSETHFDNYDQAFYNYFNALETPEEAFKEALHLLGEEQLNWFISPEEQLLEDPNLTKSRFNIGKIGSPGAEQKPNSLAIAKGGSGGAQSGQGGHNPKGGVRVGGKPMGGSAVKVAGGRLYRGYRGDEVIGVRRFEAALRVLRQLACDEGPKDEFDLEGTIDATCRNAGKLKIVWDRPRKNKMKVLVVMDSGGSMDSYIDLCSQLFTAVKRSTNFFKELKFYYFHNCIYEDIYVKPACIDVNAIKTNNFLQEHDPDYRLIIVGDASMAPSELTEAGGAIDIDHNNTEPGLVWLERVISHFDHAVWINPIPAWAWDERFNYRAQSIAMIRNLIPMYELTIEGLSQAVKKLKVRY